MSLRQTAQQLRSRNSNVNRSDSQRTSSTHRRALADGMNRANSVTTNSRSARPRELSPPPNNVLPHHESLMNENNGPLTVRNVTVTIQSNHPSGAADNSDSKRSSQVSTASTNASSTKGKKRKSHIGPWQLGSDIGKGGCGKVRLVRHVVTGQQAAAKIISKKVAEKARAESLVNLIEKSKKSRTGVFANMENVMPFGIEREVVIMKLLEHPNVVKLYDVWENRGELYLIMEYIEGGELFEYVEHHERLEEDETIWLFRQIVAALLHCHRLGIHHRDLKPENILLDQESSTVKLVDFGMAALQPAGKKLTTPCGSIHYAAPEVFEKVYDGSKVDVWSLGVILYVMLTGSTPFQYDQKTMAKNVLLWYNVIKFGDFHMPPELSPEAQDLISQMLVSNPKHRISLDQIWTHPFMQKYSAEWGETPDQLNIEHWVGPRPVIEVWNVYKRGDIDREILRNLRTLWHSEDEEVLIEKLVSPEPNQEKYFYSALQKHRDEQLENYSGPASAVSYSASDYHHAKKGVYLGEIPAIPKSAYSKTKSQYSILNDEEARSKNSVANRSPSMSSYDPYRASKTPLMEQRDNCTNVVVHRGASKKSNRTSTSTTPTTNLRHTSSHRVGASKKPRDRLSTGNSFHSIRKSSIGHSHQNSKRSISLSSCGSSTYHTGARTAIVIKPSSIHKRNVGFSHESRSSSVNILKGPHASQTRLLTPNKLGDASKRYPDSSPTPANAILPQVKSRKENKQRGRRADIPDSQTNSQVIDCEARKVSTELEKFCEEVFYRSSGASSNMTSGGSASWRTYDTPPSSISNKVSDSARKGRREWKNEMDATPTLPRATSEPPNETPTTFMTRELAETRRKLAARYASDESAQNTTYSDVLAHLDLLLNPAKRANVNASPVMDTRRTSSAPEPRSPEYPASLAAISEESRSTIDNDQLVMPMAHSRQEKRAASDPFTRPTSPSKREYHQDEDLRMPGQFSSARVEPLVIRKTCSMSSDILPGHDEGLRSSFHKESSSGVGTTSKRSSAGSGGTGQLKTIREESPRGSTQPQRASHELVKKKSWFWNKSRSRESTKDSASEGIRIYEDLDDRRKGRSIQAHSMASNVKYSLDLRDDQAKESRRGPSSSFPPAIAATTAQVTGHLGLVPEKRPGFLKFLSRRNGPKAEPTARVYVTGDEDEFLRNDSSTALSMSSHGRNRNLLSPTQPQQQAYSPADLGVQQSWLSRFLHIKPASRILCFQVGRGVARQELVRLFRRWRVHGIRDIGLDRERNLIFGRLAANNILGLKEVAFVVEVFVVLGEGKRVGLSMSRWTQRWGAASSFRRIVNEVEAVLKGRGMLVTDKNVTRDMEAILSNP